MLARYCLGQPQPLHGDSPPSPHDAPTRQSLSTRVLQQSALVCVETALETVALMRRFLQHDGTLGLLPAWWYRLFYIYTAGAVLMAARLRPRCFPAGEVDTALAETMTILREHEQFGLAAKRCVVALEILSGKIGEKTSGMSRVASRVGSANGQRQPQDPETGQLQHPDHTNGGAAADPMNNPPQHDYQQQHSGGHYAMGYGTRPALGLGTHGGTIHNNGLRQFGPNAASSSRLSMGQHHMFDVGDGAGSMAPDAGLDSLFFDMDDTQWLTYVPADF